MLLTKTCDYGIRAAQYIAIHEDRQFVPIREISEKLNISFHFLTKILQILTQNNLMISFKGPNGGVALARPADQIKLKEIIVAIDGSDIFEKCVIGLEECNDEKPCPLHQEWAVIRSQIDDLFGHTSLADMAAKLKSEQFRLVDERE